MALLGATQESMKKVQYYLLTVLGSASFWIWAFSWSLSGAIFPPGFGNAQDAYVASMFSYIAFALILLYFFMQGKVRDGLKGMKYALLAAAAITTIEILVPFVMFHSFVARVALVVCGVCNGMAQMYASVCWGARYIVAGKRSFFVIAASFLLVFIALAIINLLPYPSATLIIVVMPLVSLALWRTEIKLRTSCPNSSSHAKTQNVEALAEVAEGDVDPRLLPWKTILILSVVGFYANLFINLDTGFAHYGSDPKIFPAFILAALLCVVYLCVRRRSGDRVDLRGAYLVLMPACSWALLLIVANGGAISSLDNAIFLACAFLFHVVIWAQLADAAIITGASPLITYSLGGVFVTVLQMVGGFTARALSSLGLATEHFVSAFAMLAVVIIVILVSALISESVRPSESESTTQNQLADNFENSAEERVHAFAEKIGLTDREAEICGYLLRGRNIPWIAEELFITSGTVKSHSSRIFAKAGVESRQQLIDQFEEMQ